MERNPKMIIAMRRNKQKRNGECFIQEITESLSNSVNLELLEPEKTLDLEDSIYGRIKNDKSELLRESGLCWEEVSQRIDHFLLNSDSSTFTVLLCSKPEFSFTCPSKDDLRLLSEPALNADGDTIYVIESSTLSFGFGIDKYEEGAEWLFEFNNFKF